MQIKTISEANAEVFDEKVNAALKAGWELRRRGAANFAFYAELVKGEKTCTNCCHQNSNPSEEPCSACNEDYSKWSPITEPPSEAN